MVEVWKDIEDYKGYYQVSNKGRVKSLDRMVLRFKYCDLHIKERILKSALSNKGYVQYFLSKDGKRKTFKVHRLVAQAFLPNPEHKPEVNHIDGIKTNNQVDNLEWLTAKENMLDAVKNGFLQKGKNHPRARGVVQMDILGNVLKKFDSIVDVKKKLKINCGNIVSVCKGNLKTAGGFGWAYV